VKPVWFWFPVIAYGMALAMTGAVLLFVEGRVFDVRLMIVEAFLVILISGCVIGRERKRKKSR
jgi:hypothetical protein